MTARPFTVQVAQETLDDLRRCLFLYPSDRHLGNLRDPETKDYLLGLFRAAS